MPQQQSDPFAAYVVKSKDADPFAQYVVKAPLPTRPVSAEDYLPPQPSGLENAWSAAKGLGRALNPMPVAEALADLQRGALGGDLEAARRTVGRVGGMLGAQAGEVGQAVDAARSGRYSEAAGHGLAAAVPVVGPAAARVGELAETDPYGALGEGAGLVASVESPRWVPPVARGARAAAGPVARGAVALAKDAELATAAGGAVGAAMGGPLGAAAGTATARAMSRIFGRVLDMAKSPAAENAGGRVVKGVGKNIDNVIADALEELRAPAPTSAGTLPPQPELPAGYTPRTTVPKPKLVTSKPSKPAPSPQMGPRNYFLKTDAVAPAVEAAPRNAGGINVEDLPTSWRSRTMQDAGVKGVAQADMAQAFADELAARGVSAKEAIDLVSKNPNLPPNVRLEIVRALKAGAQ